MAVDTRFGLNIVCVSVVLGVACDDDNNDGGADDSGKDAEVDEGPAAAGRAWELLTATRKIRSNMMIVVVSNKRGTNEENVTLNFFNRIRIPQERKKYILSVPSLTSSTRFGSLRKKFVYKKNILV